MTDSMDALPVERAVGDMGAHITHGLTSQEAKERVTLKLARDSNRGPA
jgi:hypothetical protein